MRLTTVPQGQRSSMERWCPIAQTEPCEHVTTRDGIFGLYLDFVSSITFAAEVPFHRCPRASLFCALACHGTAVGTSRLVQFQLIGRELGEWVKNTWLLMAYAWLSFMMV